MAPPPLPPNGEILLYQTEDGRTRIERRFENETLWLTQALMADLFQTTPQNITLHIKSLYEQGEAVEAATCKDYLQVRQEAGRKVRRAVKYYNLDVILAIGYRVRSPRGTQFRRWATERLKEYLVKGFTMDDERLRNPPVEGSGLPDYFDELLERIRDILASERRMYLRVKELFALAADYDAAQKSTVEFFKITQNKLHFAATGHTAAELIARRADHALPNMGLTTWKGQTVRKQDVTVAKNYLSEEEIEGARGYCEETANQEKKAATRKAGFLGIEVRHRDPPRSYRSAHSGLLSVGMAKSDEKTRFVVPPFAGFTVPESKRMGKETGTQLVSYHNTALCPHDWTCLSARSRTTQKSPARPADALRLGCHLPPSL